MTVSLGVAMALGAGSLVVWTLRGQAQVQAQVETTCKRKVTRHERRYTDLAHTTLPKRYVTREELSDKVHRIDKRLDRLEQGQQQAQDGQRQILRELRRRRRRNP